MRRDFAFNLALLLGVNALVKPLYLFGIDLGVQNAVGTEAYGLYAFWFSFAFLFGVVHDFGLQNYNSVTLSKQPLLLRERLPVMLSLKLTLSVAFIVLTLTAAVVYGARGRILGLVTLAALYHTTLSVLQLLRTNLGAQEKYRFNSLVSVADKALLIIALGAILLVPSWREWLTIEHFFIFQIVAILIVIGIVVKGTSLEPGQRWLRWDSAAVVGMLRATWPFALIYVLSTLFTRVDMVMIEFLHPNGLYQIGLYAGTYRLLDAFNVLGFMFATLLLPMLSKEVVDGRSGAQVLRLAGGFMVALAVGFASYTTFFGEELTSALYTEATPEWGQVLSVLMWAATGTGLVYVYGSYLLVRERVDLVNWLGGGALLINVCLNWVLIPKHGALGAAAATVATHASLALAEFILSRQLTRRGSKGTRWWPLLGYALLVLATAYVLAWLDTPWPIALFVHAAACLTAGLGTGLIADLKTVLGILAAKVNA